MKQFSSLTIGDQAYFHAIYFSIQKIKTLYPEAPIHIYDWGFTGPQQEKLREEKNVALIPWEKRFIDVAIHFSSWRQKLRLAYNIAGIRDFLFFILHPASTLKDHTYAGFLQREMLFANKVLCMQDYLKQYGDNFIFLDGDAALMQRIDEVFDGSFDIGVTLREPAEIRILPNSCSVLNTGVLFFLGGESQEYAFYGTVG